MFVWVSISTIAIICCSARIIIGPGGRGENPIMGEVTPTLDYIVQVRMQIGCDNRAPCMNRGRHKSRICASRHTGWESLGGRQVIGTVPASPYSTFPSHSIYGQDKGWRDRDGRGEALGSSILRRAGGRRPYSAHVAAGVVAAVALWHIIGDWSRIFLIFKYQHPIEIYILTIRRMSVRRKQWEIVGLQIISIDFIIVDESS